MWRDDALLLDIVIAASDAGIFVNGLTWTDFEQSRLHQNAVIRCLEIIGEAASKLSNEVREAHPTIPWRDIINMRHRLIHGYDVVRLDVVWSVVRDDIPHLLATLSPSIPPEA